MSDFAHSFNLADFFDASEISGVAEFDILQSSKMVEAAANPTGSPSDGYLYTKLLIPGS